jgi:hypothetical protein
MADERFRHYIVVGNRGRKIIMKTLAGTSALLADPTFFHNNPVEIFWGTNLAVPRTAI